MDPEGRGEVLWESNDTWVFRAVPAPDGERLAVRTVAFASDIWMIEGF